MGPFAAIVKGGLTVASFIKHKSEIKKAQRKAYKQACKKAGNHYDPNWRKNYQKFLNKNIQKANDRKEIRSIVINTIIP